MNRQQRILVGMSGASGAPITIELLRALKQREDVETHLIITKGAELTLIQETEMTLEKLMQLADICYDNENIGASPASGSFRMDGMIVAPCSMKTIAGIASGYSDNLLLRAADVMLKERRKLVLIARESPFNTIHLRNMYELSQMGAVIMPPMMTYYRKQETLEECTKSFTERILQQFELEGERWEWIRN